jgi:curved DNA-binding protein CbpA
MREEADLYGMLGVGRDAPAGEIRRAYRRLARQHHPDLNPHPDGAQRFSALSHAYEILHDPRQRARYDHSLAPRPPAPSRRSPQPGRPVAPGSRIARRGTLELSPGEARYLAHDALVLCDPRGGTIVLPAGTRPGDQIIVLWDEQPAALTVWMNESLDRS